MSFSDDKAEIRRVLEDRIKDFKCPICGNDSFSVANGFTLNAVHDDLKRVNPHPGQGIPAITLICTNCGFLSQHSAVALGLVKAQ